MKLMKLGPFESICVRRRLIQTWTDPFNTPLCTALIPVRPSVPPSSVRSCFCEGAFPSLKTIDGVFHKQRKSLYWRRSLQSNHFRRRVAREAFISGAKITPPIADEVNHQATRKDLRMRTRTYIYMHAYRFRDI